MKISDSSLAKSALDASGGAVSADELAYREIVASEAANLINRNSGPISVGMIGIIANTNHPDAAEADAARSRDYSSATAMTRRDMNPMLAHRKRDAGL